MYQTTQTGSQPDVIRIYEDEVVRVTCQIFRPLRVKDGFLKVKATVGITNKTDYDIQHLHPRFAGYKSILGLT